MTAQRPPFAALFFLAALVCVHCQASETPQATVLHDANETTRPAVLAANHSVGVDASPETCLPPAIVRAASLVAMRDVRTLISQGVNLAVADCDGTPLLVGLLRLEVGDADLGGAAGRSEARAFLQRQKARLEIARTLIRAGAPVDATDHHGTTPLHAIMTFPPVHPQLVEVVVRDLITHGAPIHAVDAGGDTPEQVGSIWPPKRAAVLKKIAREVVR